MGSATTPRRHSDKTDQWWRELGGGGNTPREGVPAAVPAQLLALGFPEWKCVVALQANAGNAADFLMR